MVVLVVLALLVATSAPAHAYIDPGSGSYMLQLSMAGLLAIVFTIKLHWRRLRARLTEMLSHRHAGERGRA